MPHHCWKTAKTIPSINTRRTPGCDNALQSYFSFTSLAANQRGLSGIMKANIKNKAAGNASAQNIHRHACSIPSAGSCEVPSVNRFAIIQLASCADNIPNTIVSWFKDTSFPRISVGDTSAIYMGETLEAIPIPSPPTIR